MGNVILIGFMGSGKTTVGLKLSYYLRRPVIDTDKEIEREEKRTVSEIFAADGEEYFRDKETECLRKLLKETGDRIISVGGGLPLREQNRELLHRLGKVFYLRAGAETIYERLKYDTTRPLLQGDDPKGRIRTLLDARDAAYRAAADVIVDVDNKEFDRIIDEIGSICRMEEKHENISDQRTEY